jgi:hypothetical protein
MNSCQTCTKKNKQNNNRLNPLLCPITYESSKIITELCLPRKYTNTHNDLTREIYISIGHEYNSKLLLADTEKARVIGKWVKNYNKYQIHLQVLVSEKNTPESVAKIRNDIFCAELAPVLEGFALAETGLLKSNPKLGKTKIYVHFKSFYKKYERIEYWGRLNYWS